MFPEESNPKKVLRGINALESSFAERFMQYKDGLITKGELLNSLIVPLNEEVDKYADELENKKGQINRELILIGQ